MTTKYNIYACIYVYFIYRPGQISQKLRKIQEKILYESCRFSWRKESGNNGF